MNLSFKALWRLVAVLAICLCAAAPAHAKKGLAIINTGDELFEVADFPADITEKFKGASGVKAGYKCSHFGIFWADVWTWDCKMVAVMGTDSYGDLPTEVATRLSGDPQYAFSNAKRGFWNKYAFWLLMALLVVGGIWSMTGNKKDSAEAASA